MASWLVQKGRYWQLRRVVRAAFQHVEARREITKSLKTDSRSEAERRARTYWASLESGWRAKAAGDDVNAKVQFEAAQKIATDCGFAYRTMDDRAAGPLDEI